MDLPKAFLDGWWLPLTANGWVRGDPAPRLLLLSVPGRPGEAVVGTVQRLFRPTASSDSKRSVSPESAHSAWIPSSSVTSE